MKTAILIPCYNEEITIGKVIRDFKKELPEAKIYVFDNNSTDNTSEIAQKNGGIVIHEPRQGKGNVVCSMFRIVEADIYIMVDGDDTYPAEHVHELMKPVLHESFDMVCGDRVSSGSYGHQNKRAFHDLGNFIVPYLINILFNVKIKDAMTGYRVFSRRLVKKLPILSKGFEIEVEMMMTSLHYNFCVKELPITYRERPEGSFSKLNTFRDGVKILLTIFEVFRKYRPFTFFSLLSGLIFFASLFLGAQIIVEFFETGLVKRFPTAFLSLGLSIIAVIFFSIGLVLTTISRMNRELMDVNIKTFDNFS